MQVPSLSLRLLVQPPQVAPVFTRKVTLCADSTFYFVDNLYPLAAEVCFSKEQFFYYHIDFINYLFRNKNWQHISVLITLRWKRGKKPVFEWSNLVWPFISLQDLVLYNTVINNKLDLHTSKHSSIDCSVFFPVFGLTLNQLHMFRQTSHTVVIPKESLIMLQTGNGDEIPG